MNRPLLLLAAAALALMTTACGGSSINAADTMAQLRTAIDSPVESSEDGQANSRLVETALEENIFDSMLRQEVQDAIGRGDPCSRHPRCAQNGFEDDDWFYTVGQMGESSTGTLPIMILGFDHTGRVVRSWNMSTH